jgi:hypothetical protein
MTSGLRLGPTSALGCCTSTNALRQDPQVAGEHDLLAQCLISAGPDQELILGVLAVVNIRSLESIYVNSVSFNNTTNNHWGTLSR